MTLISSAEAKPMILGAVICPFEQDKAAKARCIFMSGCLVIDAFWHGLPYIHVGVSRVGQDDACYISNELCWM